MKVGSLKCADCRILNDLTEACVELYSYSHFGCHSCPKASLTFFAKNVWEFFGNRLGFNITVPTFQDLLFGLLVLITNLSQVLLEPFFYLVYAGRF